MSIDLDAIEAAAKAATPGLKWYLSNEKFSLKANPPVVLELVRQLREKESEILVLHLQLAAEKLRADQGCQRWQSANKDRLRMELVGASDGCGTRIVPGNTIYKKGAK